MGRAPRKSVPQVWVVAAQTEKGLIERRTFGTRHEALAWRRDEPQIHWGDEVFRAVVVRDSPRLNLRVDDIRLTRDFEVAQREIWLKRCAPWLTGLQSSARKTRVFVWEDTPPRGVFASRFGGPPLLRYGEAHPRCADCGSMMSFVGALDFRGSSLRTHAGGDLLAAWFCFECGASPSHAARWYSRGDAILEACTPLEAKAFPCRAGRAMTTIDLPSRRGDERHPYWNPGTQDHFLVGHGAYGKVTAWATKIGGHQFWVQGEEVPKCSCRRQMRWIGQFSSALEIQMDDAGIMYIFYCSTGRCGQTTLVTQGF